MRRAVFGVKLKKENEFFMLYGSQNIVGRHGAYTLLAGCAQGQVFPCCLGNRTLASVSPDFDAEMFNYAIVVFRVCHTSAGRCLQSRR